MLQNKKGQKNLRYPAKKQSLAKRQFFSLEKDCFFVRYRTSNFFGPSYFEAALVRPFINISNFPIFFVDGTLFKINIMLAN